MVPIRPMLSLTRSFVSALKCFSERAERRDIPSTAPPKMQPNATPLVAKEFMNFFRALVGSHEWMSDVGPVRVARCSACAPIARRPAGNRLLPSLMLLDHRLDLLLHRVEVEGARV